MKPSRAGWWWAETIDGSKIPVEVESREEGLSYKYKDTWWLIDERKEMVWHGPCIEVCQRQFIKNWHGSIILIADDGKEVRFEMRTGSKYETIGLLTVALDKIKCSQ